MPARPLDSITHSRKTKLAVFEAITPGPFHSERLRQEVRNVIHRTQTKMRQLFDRTTRTWETDVEWDEKESTAGGIAYAEVSTDNELYYMIDHGAEPHLITAVNYATLVFHGSYEAKTEPGVIDSSRSFHAKSFRRKVEVDHPGFEPRDFEGAVRAEVEDDFRDDCQDALNNFARNSGHHMDGV